MAAEAQRLNREQTARLGAELRASRQRRKSTQSELGSRVGLSQSAISLVERGLGATLSLDAWQRLFLAVDRRLLVDASRDAAEATADASHLAMQELVLRTLGAAGMRATVELPTRPLDPRRSADIALLDDRRRRIVLVECWNAFSDIGAAIRSTDRKATDASMIAAARWGEAAGQVHVLWVVRATKRNRALVGRYPSIFATRFPGSSVAWVRALTGGSDPPAERGLAWCDLAVTRILPWRRR
jgi:transcriptional regulator with XRE-family HTH domain